MPKYGLQTALALMINGDVPSYASNPTRQLTNTKLMGTFLIPINHLILIPDSLSQCFHEHLATPRVGMPGRNGVVVTVGK